MFNVIHEPAAEYFAKGATHLSSHALADFRKCPLFYYKRHIQHVIPSSDTSAYLEGRAAHALILEGREVFNREFVTTATAGRKTLMLVNDFSITPVGFSKAKLSWQTLRAELESWVFVNGKPAAPPLASSNLNRELTIKLAQAEFAALEIHDAPAGVEVVPLAPAPNTTPTLQWNPLALAVRYRIYHQQAGQAEKLVLDQAAESFRGETIFCNCPVVLNGQGGIWHFLRVEAVDRYGNESTRQTWRYYSHDLPNAPYALNIENGGMLGKFRISLES